MSTIKKSNLTELTNIIFLVNISFIIYTNRVFHHEQLVYSYSDLRYLEVLVNISPKKVDRNSITVYL